MHTAVLKLSTKGQKLAEKLTNTEVFGSSVTTVETSTHTSSSVSVEARHQVVSSVITGQQVVTITPNGRPQKIVFNGNVKTTILIEGGSTTKVNTKNAKTVKVGYDGTQWGHKTESTTAAKDLDLPTTCKMKRPAGV